MELLRCDQGTGVVGFIFGERLYALTSMLLRVKYHEYKNQKKVFYYDTTGGTGKT